MKALKRKFHFGKNFRKKKFSMSWTNDIFKGDRLASKKQLERFFFKIVDCE